MKIRTNAFFIDVNFDIESYYYCRDQQKVITGPEAPAGRLKSLHALRKNGSH
jgi:hypothetical protein